MKSSLSFLKHSQFKFSFLLLFTFPLLVWGQSDILWGQIKKVVNKNSAYSYYITYQEDDKELAYPIEFDAKKVRIDQNVGKRVLLSGKVKMVRFDSDGATIQIPVFAATSLRSFKLADLAVKPETLRSHHQKEKRSSNGGIKLNDTVANTLIFAGGAVLMGKILSDLLKK